MEVPSWVYRGRVPIVSSNLDDSGVTVRTHVGPVTSNITVKTTWRDEEAEEDKLQRISRSSMAG
jgi:hypothetical protein